MQEETDFSKINKNQNCFWLFSETNQEQNIMTFQICRIKITINLDFYVLWDYHVQKKDFFKKNEWTNKSLGKNKENVLPVELPYQKRGEGKKEGEKKKDKERCREFFRERKDMGEC